MVGKVPSFYVEESIRTQQRGIVMSDKLSMSRWRPRVDEVVYGNGIVGRVHCHCHLVL